MHINLAESYSQDKFLQTTAQLQDGELAERRSKIRSQTFREFRRGKERARGMSETYFESKSAAGSIPAG